MFGTRWAREGIEIDDVSSTGFGIGRVARESAGFGGGGAKNCEEVNLLDRGGGGLGAKSGARGIGD